MAYLKGFLSGVAALLVAEFIPGPWSIFTGISQEKAIGLAALVGRFVAALFSPLFWLVALLLFFLFFAAGRLRSNSLRILLFWVPTIICSTIAAVLMAFLVLVFLHLALRRL